MTVDRRSSFTLENAGRIIGIVVTLGGIIVTFSIAVAMTKAETSGNTKRISYLEKDQYSTRESMAVFMTRNEEQHKQIMQTNEQIMKTLEDIRRTYTRRIDGNR